MTLPTKLRQILGRTRLAVNFVLGRQVMTKGVASFDDDVWMVSYPKSGNTWTRFLIANLVSGEEAVDWTNIERRAPDIYLVHDWQVRSLPRPRYFKSHESYRPEYRSVILIVRDPRDVAVSYFHFLRKSHHLAVDGSMERFVSDFIGGRHDSYGSWGENVGSWLGARGGTKDFLVVRYEDMQSDTERELVRIADMLKIAVDERQLRRAVENSRADHMRALEQSQQTRHKFLKRTRADIPFVRAATSGQWKTELPAEAARQIEAAWGGRMRELGYLP